MTIISDLNEAQRLAEACRRPCLSFLPFSVPELLRSIQIEIFPDVRHVTRFSFVNHGPLACVSNEAGTAPIYLHQLLNHPDTPLEVVCHILKHELLHLRIPSRVIDGKNLSHPPEFWEAEKLISSGRKACCAWIRENLGAAIERDPRLDGFVVLKNWKKVWNWPKTGITFCDDRKVEELEFYL